MDKNQNIDRGNILFFIDSLKSIGGAEQMFIDQANYFAKVGVPTYFALSHSRERKDFSKNLNLANPVAYFFFKNIFDISSYLKLRKYIKQNNIKVLYAYLDYSNMVARMMKFFVPGLRIIIVEPGDPGRKTTWMRILDWFLNFGTYKVFAMSDAIRDRLIEYLSIHKKKILGMRNGVHQLLTDEQVADKWDSSNSEKYTLLHVGNMHTENKGHEALIKTVKEITEQRPDIDVQLILVGDGSMKPGFVDLTKDLGIVDKVVFTGAVPHEEIKQCFLQADVFLFNSRTEGGAAGIMEATSAGLPTVSSDFASAKEVVVPGETGWIVARDDVKSFAKYAIELYESREKLVDMSKKSFEFYKENFTYARLADQFIEEIYS